MGGGTLSLGSCNPVQCKMLGDDVSSALGRVPSLNANLLGNLVGLPRLRSPIAMGFRQLCVVASYRKSGDVSSAVGRVPSIKPNC